MKTVWQSLAVVAATVTMSVPAAAAPNVFWTFGFGFPARTKLVNGPLLSTDDARRAPVPGVATVEARQDPIDVDRSSAGGKSVAQAVFFGGVLTNRWAEGVPAAAARG